MSHVTAIKVEIDKLEDLKKAVEAMGGIWREGQRTYKWYGRHVGDYPMPEGFTEADLGKCDHAIGLPGVNYEVGVVKKANGKYTLLYDFYGHSGQHDGMKLKSHFGDNLGKLVTEYGVNRMKREARMRGYAVQRKQVGEKTKLVLQKL